MSEKIKKAYSILGTIRRNFNFLIKIVFLSCINLWLGLILNMLIVFGHHIQFKMKKKCGKGSNES